MPKYNDTAADAIKFLKADSDLNLDGATAEPDPQVEWVWRVWTPACDDIEFAVVYLADEDFECSYRDDDEEPRSELAACLGL